MLSSAGPWHKMEHGTRRTNSDSEEILQKTQGLTGNMIVVDRENAVHTIPNGFWNLKWNPGVMNVALRSTLSPQCVQGHPWLKRGKSGKPFVEIV